MEDMSGARSLVKSLKAEGVTVVFGLPGGAILPAYDALATDGEGLRHILVRHEQGAGHAAEGYATATGNVGVCIATSGPGATNLVTPIADAYLDSVPMVAITGQVPSHAIGTDAFQEANITGVVQSLTKHSFLITEPEDIPSAIKSAFHIASTGRPGPVLVDISKDALVKTAPYVYPEEVNLPGYDVVTSPEDFNEVRSAVELMIKAQKPMFYVGGGVVRADATNELVSLVNLTGFPVVTTLTARGVIPDSHPANLGMPGMHGTVAAVIGLQESDLIIAIGARFDDRVTGELSSFAPHAKIIHIDIDPAEINKNRQADVGIVGDAKNVMNLLNEILRTKDGVGAGIEEWWKFLRSLQETYPLGYDTPTDGKLSPQYVMGRINALTPADSIYVAGVGQHQMWASQFITHENPKSWLSSSGLGTMGYAVPAAMGAKVGWPEKTVWAIDGDGCFQMTSQELVTCALNNIPIKVAIINNSSLGMVRQWQTLFYDKRYSNTDLHSYNIPDFVKLAESYGCYGYRAETVDEVDVVIEKALGINDTPVVIDFRVSQDAMVWPMVPAGTSNDAITVLKDLTPVWDRED